MRTISRRAFLETAGFCLAGGVFLTGCAGRKIQPPSPKGKLRVAVIGLGSQGRFDCRELMRFADRVTLTAICDPDGATLARTAAILKPFSPDLQTFSDYRTLFRALDPAPDAVVIATPDHHHAFAATLAMKRGCAVYVEPPLARTLDECRALRALAAKRGTVLTLGDQGAATKGFLHGVRALEAEALGDVAEIWSWSDAPAWPQSVSRPAGEDPLPAGFDWNLWLGGAPFRPFKRGAYHTGVWRGWYDFGTGALGAAGIHLLNLPFRGLGIRSVSRVEVAGLPFDAPESYPASSRVRFFCTSIHGKPFTLNWLEGGQLPPASLLAGVKETFGSVPGAGCIIVGSKGRLLGAHERCEYVYAAVGAEARFEPVDRHPALAACKPPPPREGRLAAFLTALAEGERRPFECDHAAGLTELVLTGCLAQRTRTTLDWDAKRGTFTGNDAANALIRQKPRAGWR